mmetsp:Transcript_23250/g.68621  ORF Transcript_23250/g.68621 Transcript_23250/m.68621 type:complete len:202 (+) Transcript_23250:1793-2398(+)
MGGSPPHRALHLPARCRWAARGGWRRRGWLRRDLARQFSLVGGEHWEGRGRGGRGRRRAASRRPGEPTHRLSPSYAGHDQLARSAGGACSRVRPDGLRQVVGARRPLRRDSEARRHRRVLRQDLVLPPKGVRDERDPSRQHPVRQPVRGVALSRRPPGVRSRARPQAPPGGRHDRDWREGGEPQRRPAAENQPGAGLLRAL